MDVVLARALRLTVPQSSSLQDEDENDTYLGVCSQLRTGQEELLAGSRGKLKSSKVTVMVAKSCCWCCWDDCFMLRDCGHVTKSFCALVIPSARGSMTLLPPTPNSCRRDKKEIRSLKSMKDLQVEGKNRMINVIFKSQRIPDSEMLHNYAFLRIRCVAKCRHCQAPGTSWMIECGPSQPPGKHVLSGRGHGHLAVERTGTYVILTNAPGGGAYAVGISVEASSP